MKKIKNVMMNIKNSILTYFWTTSFVFNVMLFSLYSTGDRYVKMKRSGERLYNGLSIEDDEESKKEAKEFMYELYHDILDEMTKYQ